MILEVRTVSRKTPRDGRLEVTEATARRLALVGAPVPVALDEAVADATLEAFACTCGAAKGDGHVHHFVVSPLLTALREGETVVLEWLDETRLEVARAHPLGDGHDVAVRPPGA